MSWAAGWALRAAGDGDPMMKQFEGGQKNLRLGGVQLYAIALPFVSCVV